MIITQQDGCHKVLGDVTKIETSIDVKNLDFITTLLSSNLYSNPEQSFIREIVSNAWDSHVEAGTTDTPILIQYDGEWFTGGHIIIRDYGTGLSYDKFVELYCSIGNSSKRESNKYIGGFGIGRYASLALSNTVEIISYYEGTKYVYFLSKSGNTINTDFIDSYKTDEPNGLQVKVKINDRQYDRIKDSLKYISFFPNVFLKNFGGMTKTINESTIYDYTNFSVSTVYINNYRTLHVLIGNVLYPLDRHIFDNNSDYDTLLDCEGLAIKLDIGTVNITPNRENIIYTPNTIKIITEKLAEVCKEVKELVYSNVTLDKQDFKEYIKAIRGRLYFNFADKAAYSFRHECTSISIHNDFITYKGKDYLDFWKMIKYTKHPQLDVKYHFGKFKTKQHYYNNDLISFYNVDHIYKLKSFTKFTTLNKGYILTKIDPKENCIFVTDNVKFEDLFLEASCKKPEILDFVKLYFEEVIKNAKEIDFSSKDYNDYKEKQKQISRELRLNTLKDNDNVSLVELRPVSTYREEKTLAQWKTTFQKSKACIVLIPYTKRNYYHSVIQVLYQYKKPFKRYHFYTGSEQALKKINSLKLRNTTDIVELCNKNRVLSIMKTLCFIDVKNYNILNKCSLWCKNKYDYILKALNIVSDYSNHRDLEYIKEIPQDDYLIKTIIKYNELVDKCNSIISDTDRLYKYSDNISFLLCMKQKLFSPSMELYKDIKNDLVYKILCQK